LLIRCRGAVIDTVCCAVRRPQHVYTQAFDLRALLFVAAPSIPDARRLFADMPMRMLADAPDGGAEAEERPQP